MSIVTIFGGSNFLDHAPEGIIVRHLMLIWQLGVSVIYEVFCRRHLNRVSCPIHSILFFMTIWHMEDYEIGLMQRGGFFFALTRGGRVMTVERVRLKWEDYYRALGRLQAALEKDADSDDMYLDATIQRFEFCFELAWKLIKAVLEYEGIEANSPRSCIREGWKQRLISNAETWLEMMEKRKLSSHTYDENVAREIYHDVKERHVALLESFDRTMNDWLRDAERKNT